MKQGIIILAVFLFVSLVTGLTIWAHHSPSPVYVPQAEASDAASSTSATTSTSGAKTTIPALAAFKSTETTYFYIGEPADESNDFIQNSESYWDEEWSLHFGGVDDPTKRCGYRPCGFTPKENPFYVALPYAEFDEDGNLKASATQVPWYH